MGQDQPKTYIVEKVIKKRKRKNTVEYFVKWEGYDSSQNTWEPAEHLSSCPEVIVEFEAEAKKRKSSQVPEGTPEGKRNDSFNDSDSSSPKRSFKKAKKNVAGVELDDVLDKSSVKVTGFARNLKPERIAGAVDNEGDYCFLIKWRGCDETEIVPAKEAHQKCPQLVIKFYENRIAWKPTSTSR